MTVVNKLFKGSVFRLISKMTSILIAFLLLPLLVSSLGDKDYGIWILIAAIGGYYGALDFGLSSAVIRFVSKNREKTTQVNKYLSTSFYLFLLIAIILMLLVTILLNTSSADVIYEVDIISTLIFISALSTAISFCSKTSIGLLSSYLQYDIIAFVQFLVSVLKGVATYLVLVNSGGLVELVYVLLLGSVIETNILLFITLRKYGNSFLSISNFDYSILKDLFSYGKYTFIAQVSDIIRNYSLPFVIAASLDVKSVTPFAIATRLWTMAGTLCSSMLSIFTPVFSRLEGQGDRIGIRVFYFKAVKITNLTGNYVAVTILVFMKPFLILWLGNQYSDEIHLVACILAISMMSSISQMPTVNLLYGVSENKKYAMSNFIQGLITLTLSWLIVDVYGIVGVAVSISIVAVVIKLGVQLGYASQTLSLSRGYLYGYTFKYMSIPILFGVIAYLLFNQLDILSWTDLIIANAINLLAYFSVVYLIVLEKEEKYYLKSRVKFVKKN